MTASYGPSQFVLSLIFICFVPTDFLSLKGISQCQGHFFKYISEICFEGENQNLQKKSCRIKTWMEFVRQILMKLKASSNEGLLMEVFSHSLMLLSKHFSGHYVTTQACTLISWGCVHLWWCGSLEDYTLCLLCCFKLWASFGSHWWIQTGVTVRKRPIWVKFNDFLAVWPWNLTHGIDKQ